MLRESNRRRVASRRARGTGCAESAEGGLEGARMDARDWKPTPATSIKTATDHPDRSPFCLCWRESNGYERRPTGGIGAMERRVDSRHLQEIGYRSAMIGSRFCLCCGSRTMRSEQCIRRETLSVVGSGVSPA